MIFTVSLPTSGVSIADQAGPAFGTGQRDYRAASTIARKAAQLLGGTSMGRKLRVLIIVENLPVPFDRRVWSEATTLRDAGHTVSVICPKSPNYPQAHEVIDGIAIYRHPLPVEARGAAAYFIEYPIALLWEFLLALRIWRRHGFDVIHACNPPDLIFLIGLFFKIFAGKSFVFDHHDANPEFYEAKFGRRGFLWQLLRLAEKLTFKAADISIATNDSYRRIAIERGGMRPDRVFVVRSGPNLERVKRLPPDPAWRKGRQFLVGYVGVISRSEGIDLLLSSISHIVLCPGPSATFNSWWPAAGQSLRR